jgi:hypothetical protein
MKSIGRAKATAELYKNFGSGFSPANSLKLYTIFYHACRKTKPIQNYVGICIL